MKDPEIDEDLRNKRVDRLVKLFKCFKSKNQSYAILMISFEFLELVNCLLQFFALNIVTNGHFITFGVDYFLSDVICDFIFPKLSKCQFNLLGQEEI